MRRRAPQESGNPVGVVRRAPASAASQLRARGAGEMASSTGSARAPQESGNPVPGRTAAILGVVQGAAPRSARFPSALFPGVRVRFGGQEGRGARTLR